MKHKLLALTVILTMIALLVACGNETSALTTTVPTSSLSSQTSATTSPYATSSTSSTATTDVTTITATATSTDTTIISSTDPDQLYKIQNPGFETGDLTGWTVLSGDAFSDSYVTSDPELPMDEVYPYNKVGSYLYGIYPESRTGEMKSSSFVVGGSGYVSFLMGGATNKGLTYVSIVEAESGTEVYRIANQAYGVVPYSPEATLFRYYVDLSFQLGRSLYFLVHDQATQFTGFITLDDFQTYYPETPDTASGIIAANIRPTFPPLAGIPNVLYNGSFQSGTLAGWTVVGEDGVFRDSDIDLNHRLSNRPDELKIGLLRSSAFKIAGEGIISFRLGATKHPDLTYLSIKQVGTNEEIFRTYSDRWKESDEENTHLYFVDLNAYYGKALYIEIVDNSREDWGLVTLEQVITYYGEAPSITDEIALNLLSESDPNREYAAMRAYIDPLIDSIADETERLTFQKTFYATLDGIDNRKGSWPSVLHYFPNGHTFIYTGDIAAMWLRDSSAQVLPYLQFMAIDPDVQSMVKGLILEQLELIRRDAYANAFNPDGSVFERKFELDSLCYPLWLAYNYHEITGDDSIFDYFFVLTVDRVIDTLIQEQNHADANYQITNTTDRSVGSLAFNPESNLIWSAYRPSDDVAYYKYNIPENMFCVATLEKMVALFTDLGLDATTSSRALALASEVRNAIETYGVYMDPQYGRIYAYEVTGFEDNINSANQKLLVDCANIPSLLAIPWLGYAPMDDETYQNTRAFILSDRNPYYHEGVYASGIGDPHDSIYTANPSLPVVWHMALAMQGITADDPVEIRQMIDYMTATTDGTFVMHEAFDADNPSVYTRDFFTWPCSLYAYLYLTSVLDVNLD